MNQKLSAINWGTLTAAQANRLLGSARRHEQATAKLWDKGEVTDAVWSAALLLEEDLLVYARTGEKPENRT